MSGGELFQGNGSGGTQKRTKGEFSGYGAPEGEDADKIVRGIRVRPCCRLSHPSATIADTLQLIPTFLLWVSFDQTGAAGDGMVT